MPTVDEIVAALRPVIRTEAQKVAEDAAAALIKVISKNRGWRLLRGSGDPVYLVTEGKKTHVFSVESFGGSGYSGDFIEEVSDAYLSKIPSR